MNYIVSKEITGKILYDEEIKWKLKVVNNVGFRTIEKWIRTNDKKLTTVDSLKVIREYYKLKPNAVITEKVPHVIKSKKQVA